MFLPQSKTPGFAPIQQLIRYHNYWQIKAMFIFQVVSQ
jgi:hypothetical protein